MAHFWSLKQFDWAIDSKILLCLQYPICSECSVSMVVEFALSILGIIFFYIKRWKKFGYEFTFQKRLSKISLFPSNSPSGSKLKFSVIIVGNFNNFATVGRYFVWHTDPVASYFSNSCVSVWDCKGMPWIYFYLSRVTNSMTYFLCEVRQSMCSSEHNWVFAWGWRQGEKCPRRGLRLQNRVIITIF